MTQARSAGQHLALMGPTASSKSAVAMELAQMRNNAGLPTEIVSCDSMQVYRHMDVGTAKPTAVDQKLVRHHLIDLVEPTEDHNLGMFLNAAAPIIEAIEERGAQAFLVGGTGLYVRGIVDDFHPPPRYPELADQLEADSTETLTARLADLDPVALGRLVGNRRRIIRALAVTLGSGKPFSSFGSALEQYADTPYVLCGLAAPRDDLAGLIAARYTTQLDDGLLEEVRYLHGLGNDLSRTAGQALGYREFLTHLRGETSFDAALSAARTRTRRFAVRQVRWFRRDPRIRWAAAPTNDGEVRSTAEWIDALWRKSTGEQVGSVGTVAQGPAQAEEV